VSLCTSHFFDAPRWDRRPTSFSPTKFGGIHISFSYTSISFFFSFSFPCFYFHHHHLDFIMASAAKQATLSVVAPADLQSFTEHLKKCRRVVALVGAGLSAASGLPTFRGAGGLWRRHDATDLATPEAFEANPDLVWQFYSFRRHMALKAAPNKAHFALAELARKNKDFITLSQNVDGKIFST